MKKKLKIVSLLVFTCLVADQKVQASYLSSMLEKTKSWVENQNWCMPALGLGVFAGACIYYSNSKKLDSSVNSTEEENSPKPGPNKNNYLQDLAKEPNQEPIPKKNNYPKIDDLDLPHLNYRSLLRDIDQPVIKNSVKEEGQSGVQSKIFDGIKRYLAKENTTFNIELKPSEQKPQKIYCKPKKAEPSFIKQHHPTLNHFNGDFKPEDKVLSNQLVNKYFPDKEALKTAYSYYKNEKEKTKKKNLVQNDPQYKQLQKYFRQGQGLAQQNFILSPEQSANENNLLFNIVSLMHHICEIANNKKQSFDEGAFIIEDNEQHAIYNLLKKYVNMTYPYAIKQELTPQQLLKLPANIKAYPRVSSHLNSYYTALGVTQKGWIYGVTKTDSDYFHYGINIPKNHFLPHSHMRHILFGQVNKENNLLFIKMEEHPPHTLGHISSTIGSYTKKILPEAISIFMGLDLDNSLDNRKERIPHKIVEEYCTLKNDDTNKPHSFGISYIYSTLQKEIAYEQQECNPQDLRTAFCNQLEKKFDNLDIRIGNEVIIRQEELYGTWQTYKSLLNNEIVHAEKLINLENRKKLGFTYQGMDIENLQNRLTTLSQRLLQKSIPDNKNIIKNDVENFALKLEGLKDNIPNIQTLISDDDELTFYKNYEASLQHLQKVDPSVDLKNLYTHIGLEKNNRFNYSVTDIKRQCNQLNQGTESSQGQLIRQIKFTLGSQKGKNAYDAYLQGQASLHMQRISPDEAQNFGLDCVELSSKLAILSQNVKHISEALTKQ